MRRADAIWIALAAALGATAGPARADSVMLTNGLEYANVTIEGAADGMVRFRIRGRTPVEKPLKEVAAMVLTDDARLTAAEAAAKEGKTALALRGYRDALKAATLSWKKTLIRYRLMNAAENGGDVALAVETWLELADAAEGVPGVVAARPKKLPARGDPSNAKAIAALEAKARTVRSTMYLRTIQRLLSELYEREGRLDEARALAARLSGKAASAPTATDPHPAPSGPSVRDQLRLARLAMKAGEFRKAVGALEPTLQTLGGSDLPAALYVVGKAQSALADREADARAARALRVKAGLNLLRLVVLFGDDENVPDALVEAGRISHALGNDVAARAAWGEVVAQHKNTPAAKEAADALKKLDEK